MPRVRDLVEEATDGGTVAGDAVIAIVAAQLHPQRAALVGYGAALNTTTARASYGAVQVPTPSTVTVSVQAVGSTVDLTVHWRPETRLLIVPVQVLICWPSIGGQLMGGNMSVDLAEH